MIFMFAVVVLISIGYLWLYHLWLITTGCTTNEAVKGVWRGQRNPFNLGWRRNWQKFLYVVCVYAWCLWKMCVV